MLLHSVEFWSLQVALALSESAGEKDGGRGGGVAVVLSQREPVKKELARGKTVEGGPDS